MHRNFRSIALAVALLATAGCAQTFDATTLGVPATLATDGAQAPAGTPFKISAKAIWAGWGIIPVAQPSLQRNLASQLTGGQGIADVRIRTKTSIWDGFFTVVTLGVIVPRTVVYEGVILPAGATP